MLSLAYEQGWSEIATRRRGQLSLWNRLRANRYRMLSDETLLRRARFRDMAAFDALVGRYRDRLYSMAVLSLGNESDADDALCDMCLSAYRDIHSSSATSAPATWLYEHGFLAVFGRMNLPTEGHAAEVETRSSVQS